MENSLENQKVDPSELPFLVTHWLSNFQHSSYKPNESGPLNQIKKAASELALAFEELGSFGKTNLDATKPLSQNSRNKTYHDMKRKWSHVSTNQLEMVAESAAAAAAAASTGVSQATDIMKLAHERTVYRNDNGRKLGETIDLTSAIEIDIDSGKSVRSILHKLPLVMNAPEAENMNETRQILSYCGPADNDRENNNQRLQISILSDFHALAQRSGNAMRNLLSAREEARCEAIEIKMIQRSLSRQLEVKNEAEQRRSDSIIPDKISTACCDEALEDIQNCDRVIAQLNNKLSQLQTAHKSTKERLIEKEGVVRITYSECKRFIRNFSDPRRIIRPFSACGTLFDNHISSNIVTSFLSTRQYGLSRNSLSSYHRQMGRPLGPNGASEMRKNIFFRRFSHAVTINAHLTFPIYCLQFDKTGRYFITGADDCLVKLFSLGAGLSRATKGRPLRCTYGANARGAILVCTLRGHAGVICDIDVSPDNAFLATASDDGDVRVWGLKDGCPIAILRGHVGGANMVSWSSITPYRLVSSGMDGLARVWDIREAALKRYASHIGTRSDYTLQLTQSEKQLLEVDLNAKLQNSMGGPQHQAMLPPIPQRDDQAGIHAPPEDPAANVALPQAPVQPNADAGNEGNINREINTGAFVANDVLDEGVQIIGKLQHGERAQESSGPGTRSRHRKVKVICVARCPRGGHFATGSDDGHCRVWQDNDDIRVALIDARSTNNKNAFIGQLKRVPSNENAVPSTSTLLTTLMGHMSSITDLHYSHAGDRILTASQKDGNARIWSFGFQNERGLNRSMRDRFSDPKQIVLRLSSINDAPTPAASGRSGKKRSSASTSSVNCDVAVWSRDDSKIITSQSCPIRNNNQDIVPGSQVLLIWESWTGNCLIAIKQAHEQQCPVIVTHPFEQNIICSAGGDGFAKVWDLERGKCIYEHQNAINHGPVSQNNEKQKRSGFLDGTFDENGNTLILVDDNGRITIFDCIEKHNNTGDLSPPMWMKEQYFANDYYDLLYNTNGYCVERGSEQPPHMAPRAVRCNHSGVPYADDISEAYLCLKGPSPVLQDVASRQRNILRSKSKNNKSFEGHVRRAVLMTDFDPDQTIQIDGTEKMLFENQGTSRRVSLFPPAVDNEDRNEAGVQRTSSTSRRALSGNFRWRDFDDLIQEERLQADAGDADHDDEDFVPPVAASQETVDDEGYSSLDESEEGNAEPWASGSEASPSATARARRSARSQRMQRRNRDRDRLEVVERTTNRSTRPRRIIEESDTDDDGIVEECLSTNNVPTGPYVTDYTEAGHFFRLESKARVRRSWLCRPESASSYRGRKIYAPQVGDSVVYIPRAHRETIRKFLTLKTPWRNWPAGARWPIVRCQILNVRYRFPYKEYFKRDEEARCVSIVAILTLEVTGIPELSNDREFPWPKPVFIARQTRSTSHKFEVSLFENDCAEYVIPETLFIWRIQCLEEALRGRANNPENLTILACYFDTRDDEDPVIESSEADILHYCNVDDQVDENLNRSGFESLVVRWDDGSSESLSPWEVTTQEKAYEVPTTPPIPAIEKAAVAKALRSIELNNKFGEFTRAVDVERYPDYLYRIEVPIDLSFVRRRLEHDYYTSVLSILSEIRLIRENCEKYNGSDSPIASVANEMYNCFKEDLKANLQDTGVDVNDLSRMYENDDLPVCVDDYSNAEGNSLRPNTRARRTATRQSSLELLPPPQTALPTAPTADSNGIHEQTRRSVAKRKMSREDSSSENSDQDPSNDIKSDNTQYSSRRARNGGRIDTSTSKLQSGDRGNRKRETSLDLSPSRKSARLSRSMSRKTERPNYEEIETENEEEYQTEDAESDEDSEVSEVVTSEPEVSPDDVSDFDELQEEQAYRKTKNTRYDRREQQKSTENERIRRSPRQRERTKSSKEGYVPYAAEETMPKKAESRASKIREKTISLARSRRELLNIQSPTRQSSRARKETNYVDLDSDIDICEEEEEDKDIPGEYGISVKTEDSDSHTNTNSPTRRSTRLSRSQHTNTAEKSFTYDTKRTKKTNGHSRRIKNQGKKRGSSRTRKDSFNFELEEDNIDDESVSDHDESDSEADITRDQKLEGKKVKSTSRRASTRRRKATIDSDLEVESGQDDCDELDSDHEVRSNGNSNTDRTSKVESRVGSTARRRSFRTRKTGASSYEEVGSEEEDNYDESFSDHEDDADTEEVSVENGARVKSKRILTKEKVASPLRKRTRRTRNEEDRSEGTGVLPKLDQWPDVKLKDITAISDIVLEEMRALDKMNLFSIPVIEAYPEISEAYSQQVKNPIDFRTIQEEKLPYYSRISQLQDDLIQVFQNCVDFNGESDDLGQYAISLWGQLDEVFAAACDKLTGRGRVSNLRRRNRG